MTRATSKRIAKLFGELCAKHGLKPEALSEAPADGVMALECSAPGTDIGCRIYVPTTLGGNSSERHMRGEFEGMLAMLREAVAA